MMGQRGVHFWLGVLALVALGSSPMLSAGKGASPTPLAQMQVRLLDETAQGLLLDVRFPPPETAREAMQGDGWDHLRTPGQPAIPYWYTLLALPPGGTAEVQVVEVTFYPGVRSLSLPMAPQPQPLQAPLQAGRQEPVPATLAPGWSPSALAQLGQSAWLRDRMVAPLHLFPLQYDALRQQARWVEHLRVEVRFRPSKTAPRSAPAMACAACPDPFAGVWHSLVLNPDQARDWRGRAPLLAPSFSSLPTGTRYRVVVDTDGLYRLTYADLQAAGLPVDTLDPRQLHLTNQGREIAIWVIGEEDGRLDPGDAVLFYGQRLRGDYLASLHPHEADNWIFLSLAGRQAAFNATMIEKYTRENVYWLSVESTPGLRMDPLDATPPASGSVPQPTVFTDTVHAEESNRWWTFHFTSEDTWFWERLQTPGQPVTGTYPVTLTAVATQPFSATVRGEVVAFTHSTATNPDHHTVAWWNGRTALVSEDWWDGLGRLRFEGTIPGSALQTGQNTLDFQVQNDAGLSYDDIFFDWFEVTYQRRLEAVDDALDFSTPISGTARYEVPGFTSSKVYALEVSDPLAPRRLLSTTVSGATAPYTLTLGLSLPSDTPLLLVGESALRTPRSITAYTPPDFAAFPAADYILITHRDLLTATQRLADYRQSQGFSTLVVDIADLYNVFNYGIEHPIAIKNFLAWTFASWSEPPSYALVIGDGHWNFQNFNPSRYGTAPNHRLLIPPFLAFVDPWQGEVASLNNLATVVGYDPLPDLMLGVVPAASDAELSTWVDKVMIYEKTMTNPLVPDWRRKVMFLADNPDAAGDFPAISEALIQDYFAGKEYQVTRIYQGDASYPCNGPCVDDTVARWNAGQFLVTYTGHGSYNRWASSGGGGEVMLRNTDVPQLIGDGPPIVLSMTCLDGYYILPNSRSLVQEMLFQAGGAVATFSPAGLGVGTGHDVLNRGFLDVLLSGGLVRMGQAALGAKVRLYAAGHDLDLVQTFAVYGDPALVVNYPAPVFLPLIRR